MVFVVLMNKMKIIHVIYLFSILLLIGCSEDDETDIVFHVSVSDIKAYSATVTITHNGTNRDVYYGFITEGNADNIQSEISRFQTTASNQVFLQAAHSQRKCVFKITGLAQNHSYTFIVYGTDEDGNLHGKPAALKFTTDKSNFTASINTNWKIEYKGHTVYNNYDYSLITVSLIGDVEERFFLATYKSSVHDSFSCTEDFIAYATNQFINQKQEDVNGDFWIEDSQVRKEGTNFYRYLEEGDYVSYAIGINGDGSPTGHYVQTAFHVDHYPVVEGYSNLLGNWAIIDENDKWYFVSFTERVVNQSLIMTGWGNYMNYSVVVAFNRTDASLKISSQIIDESAEFKFSDGSEYKGRLSIRGAYYNEESKLKWISQSVTLAKASLNDDGTYTFLTGYYVTLADGSRTYNTGMTFYIESEDGTNVGFARMMFPLVMKKMDDL